MCHGQEGASGTFPQSLIPHLLSLMVRDLPSPMQPFYLLQVAGDGPFIDLRDSKSRLSLLTALTSFYLPDRLLLTVTSVMIICPKILFIVKALCLSHSFVGLVWWSCMYVCLSIQRPRHKERNNRTVQD